MPNPNGPLHVPAREYLRMSLKRSLVLGLVAGLAVSQAAIAQDAPVVAADPQPAAAAAPTAALKAGDAAPALKLAKWVKGTEVKTFEKDKVYVVEFWATWCGPCRRTIPHLTKLSKEMKDKVTVIDSEVASYFYVSELYYSALIQRIERTLADLDRVLRDPEIQTYLSDPTKIPEREAP